jgi:nitrite reductase/ring-hydroxylating ferredoxin subunit
MMRAMNAQDVELVRGPTENLVEEGKLLYLEDKDRHFLITKADGELRAFRNLCKHQFLVMEDCKVENGSLECPYHTIRYSCTSGEVTEDSGFNGVEGLTVYPTSVEAGTVFIHVPQNERW